MRAGIWVAALFWIFLPLGRIFAQDGPQTPAQSELYHGAHLPTNRAASRSLEAARELIRSGRYADGLPLIDRVLNSEADFFDPSGEGIKQIARELLNELPTAGRDAYALLYEHQLHSEVQHAVETRSIEALARIAARFPLELQGEEAWRLWAALEEEQGHYDLAANLYEKLLHKSDESDQANELSTRLTLQRLRMGVPVEKESLWNSSFSYEELSRATQKAKDKWQRGHTPNVWLGPGGGPRRNSQGASGMTIGWRAWSLALDHRHFSDSTANAATALPIAPSSAVSVWDVIVAIDEGELVAIDFATGKRLWRAGSRYTDKSRTSLSQSATFSLALELGLGKLPDPILSATLSSDGVRVFSLQETTHQRDEPPTAGRFRRFARSTIKQEHPVNSLSAFSVAEQGKLVWKIDGGDPTGTLPGAFFLGPPAPYAGRLACLAVADEVIDFIWIDGATGRVLWRQPLVNLERGLRERPSLRLSGAGITVVDGIAVCTTGAGLVGAIDIANRSLLWANWLPPEPLAMERTQRADLPGGAESAATSWLGGVGWRIPRAIVSDDRVLVASPESPGLHCYALATGERLWTQGPDSGLLLSAITTNLGIQRAITIERASLSAWDLTSGELVWRMPLPNGDSPTGEGLLVDDSYWLPLASGRIAKVEVDQDEPDGFELLPVTPYALDENTDLGTLGCSQGALFSMSPRTIELINPLVQEPTDSSTSIVALREGDLDQAIAALRKAQKTEPTSHRIANQLFVTLAKNAITQPSTSVELVNQLAEIAAGPRQRRAAALLRLHASEDLNQVTAASLDALKQELGWQYVSPAPGHLVQAESWIAARLASLRSEATAEKRMALESEAENLNALARESEDSALLTAYARAFSTLSAGRMARLDLASLLAKKNRNRDAELQQRLADPQELATTSSTASTSDWSLNQVVAEELASKAPTAPSGRATRFGRRRSPASLKVHTRVALANLHTPKQWVAHTDSEENRILVGVDQLGEVAVQLKLPAAEAPLSAQDNQLRAIQWGPLFCVSTADEVAMFDCQAGADSHHALLWRIRIKDYEASPSLKLYDARTQVNSESSDVTETNSMIESQAELLAISKHGVILLSSHGLECRDLLEGALLWRRSDLKWVEQVVITRDSLLISDAKHIRGQVISLFDGGIKEEWLPPRGNWVAVNGSKVLVMDRLIQSLAIEIKLYDFSASATEPVWKTTLPKGTLRTTLTDAGYAFLKPSGQLFWIDLAQADSDLVEADINVAPPSDTDQQSWRSLHVATHGDQLIVMLNRASADDHRAMRVRPLMRAPTVTGKVYSFNKSSGKSLWSSAAEISGLTLLDSPVKSSPWLMFAIRQLPNSSEESPSLRLVVLDAATGRTVYRTNDLPAPLASTPLDYSIRLEQLPEPSVLVRLGQSGVRLTAAKSPSPPSPPAIDRVESPESRDTGDLFGNGIEKLFQSLLNPPDENQKENVAP